MKVEFKGRTLELADALPLKLKDWKRLEKLGVNSKQFEDGAITAISNVTFYILNKLDSTITQDDVDDLDLNDPILQEVMKAVGGEKPDASFSTSSTS